MNLNMIMRRSSNTVIAPISVWHKTFVWVSACSLVIVFILGVQSARACEIVQNFEIRSPSGIHAVLDSLEVCEGPLITLTSVSKMISLVDARSGKSKIYVGTDEKATVKWESDTQLVITLVSISQVLLSIHNVGTVNVEYRVSDALRSGAFLRRAEREKVDVENKLQAGKLTQHSALARLKSIDETRIFNERFMRWIQENVGMRS